MTEEPENLVLHILREMRQDMAHRFDSLEQKVARIEMNVSKLNTATAALVRNDQYARGESKTVRLNQENHETRINLIEERLGLRKS